MTDDPIRDALELLDRPVRPEPEFADRLFERLASETKKRPALVPPRSIERPGRPDVRRALTVAAVLVAALAVIASVLGPLRGVGSHREPAGPSASTPFRMVVEGRYPASGDADAPGSFRLGISYEDAGTWRIDVLGGTAADQPLVDANVGGAGSYLLSSRGVVMAFDAPSDAFVPQPAHAAWFSPLNLLGGADPHAGWEQACANGTSLGDDVIDGRPVHGVRCAAPSGFGSTAATFDVWEDVDTSLVLRLSASPDSLGALPPGPLAWYTGESLAATSIEYDPSFASGTFTTPARATASPASGARAILSVNAGDVLPTVTGTTLTGDPFDLSSTRGKPTVLYLWADWCAPCTGAPLAAMQTAFDSRSDVNVVTLAWNADRSAIASFVRAHAYTVPVVLPDDPQALSRTWGGPDGIPTLILLDASGRLVGAYEGFNAEVGAVSDVDAILDALVGERPLPAEPDVFTAHQTG